MQHDSTAGTALVTGASSGIGATYADRLARRGHDLVLVARDRGRLEALAGRLRAETGRSAEIVAADFARDADLHAVEARLRDDRGIAMFVNNAGMAVAAPLLAADPDRLEAMVRLNVVAAMRLAVAAGLNAQHGDPKCSAAPSSIQAGNLTLDQGPVRM